jgi:hypothetical protein
VVGGILLTAAVCGALAFGGDPDSKRAKDRSADEAQQKDDVVEMVQREAKIRPKWEVLGPYDRGPERRITKLKIILDKAEALPLAQWVRRDKEFVAETNDPDTVHLAERFLTAPLRLAVADGFGSVGGPGTYYIGKVEVTTTKESYYVGICTIGFTLNSEIPLDDRVFFSWGLAKLIDDMLVEQTKEHLPERLFERLSGKTQSDGDKRFYEGYFRTKKGERTPGREKEEPDKGPKGGK